VRERVTLTAELLVRAYAAGIFPMAESAQDPELFWVDPKRRGILPLDRFHVPRRLARALRQESMDIRCDSDFLGVIRACAQATDKRPNTWINDEIVALYGELFARGIAHSVECWQDDRLVGGLYGIALGAAFFGESMFSRVTDASKVALVHLVARLRQGGFLLLDTQFLTPHLARFGGIEISRAQYRRALAEALAYRAEFSSSLRGDDPVGAATAPADAAIGGAPATDAPLQSSTFTS
jgi:leucyl/phenylalanyl-tRNA--protein transferase